MVKVEFGLVKDKPWIFYKDGEEPITVFVTEVYGKTVKFNNGDSVHVDRFYELCEPAIDEEPMDDIITDNNLIMEGLEDVIETEEHRNGGTASPIEDLMAGIQFDENGVPISDARSQNNAPRAEHQMEVRPQAIIPQQHESPLITLTEKGKTKLTKITFTIDFPTVDKTLFNALVDTYPQEEIDLLLEHMINKIGIENVKDMIKQKVLQYYKPTSKKHASS